MAFVFFLVYLFKDWKVQKYKQSSFYLGQETTSICTKLFLGLKIKSQKRNTWEIRSICNVRAVKTFIYGKLKKKNTLRFIDLDKHNLNDCLI
jgi:hypothetical protein